MLTSIVTSQLSGQWACPEFNHPGPPSPVRTGLADNITTTACTMNDANGFYHSVDHLNYTSKPMFMRKNHHGKDVSNNVEPHSNITHSLGSSTRRSDEGIKLAAMHHNSTTYLDTTGHSGGTADYSIHWLRSASDNLDRTHTSTFQRFSIQDLIQQECNIGANNYPVDQPSRLVRIECRKPGCRCVLKNEQALSLKIVPGVTLIRGSWLPTVDKPTSQNDELSGCVVTKCHSSNKPKHTAQSNNQQQPPPIILSSCCPSWFELVRTASNRLSEAKFDLWPELPMWSSGTAVWRARPRCFLLQQTTQCYLALTEQPIMMSSTDMLKQEHNALNLDADRLATLSAGTVLRLIDLRSCRLIKRESAVGSGIRGSMRIFNTRHGGGGVKQVSMLQCFVVGSKALSSLAGTLENLKEPDIVHRFTSGPKFVYLPLDSKTMMSSPVAEFDSISSSLMSLNSPIAQKHHPTLFGVHSILSILSHFRMPVLVKPLTGLRPNSFQLPGNTLVEDAASQHLNSWSNSFNKDSRPLLQLDSCYHGILVFLEPLAATHHTLLVSRCSMEQSIHESAASVRNSRFFVVTADMLASHNFLVADMCSIQKYGNHLESHSIRVAQFLAATHPVDGLNYLIRHMEDITHASNTGPSHAPLTRTLGPIDTVSRDVSLCVPVGCVAAAAALSTGDEEDLFNEPNFAHELRDGVIKQYRSPGNNNSAHGDDYPLTNCLATSRALTQSSLNSSLLASETDQANALCDEIEDIYFYVRNGHFPAQSRSMVSLPHGYNRVERAERFVRNSAPISPQPLGRLGDGRLAASSRVLSYSEQTRQPARQLNGRTATATTQNCAQFWPPQVEQFNSLNSDTARAPAFLVYRRKSDQPHKMIPRVADRHEKRGQIYHIPVVGLERSQHFVSPNRAVVYRNQDKTNAPTCDRKPEALAVRLSPKGAYDVGGSNRNNSSRLDLGSQPNLVHHTTVGINNGVGNKPVPKTYTNTRVLSMSSSKGGEFYTQMPFGTVEHQTTDYRRSNNALNEIQDRFKQMNTHCAPAVNQRTTNDASLKVRHTSFIKEDSHDLSRSMDKNLNSTPRVRRYPGHHYHQNTQQLHQGVKHYQDRTSLAYTSPNPSSSFEQAKCRLRSNVPAGRPTLPSESIYEHQQSLNFTTDRIVHNVAHKDTYSATNNPLPHTRRDQSGLVLSPSGTTNNYRYTVTNVDPANAFVSQSNAFALNSSTVDISKMAFPVRICNEHHDQMQKRQENNQLTKKYPHDSHKPMDNSCITPTHQAGSSHQWREIPNSSPDTGIGEDSGIEISHVPASTKLITLRNWRKTAAKLNPNSAVVQMDHSDSGRKTPLYSG